MVLLHGASNYVVAMEHESWTKMIGANDWRKIVTIATFAFTAVHSRSVNLVSRD